MLTRSPPPPRPRSLPSGTRRPQRLWPMLPAVTRTQLAQHVARVLGRVRAAFGPGRCVMLTAPNEPAERVTTAHRAKLAYVYIRQSTAGQVRQHQESTALQYRLVERAAELG